MIQVAGELGRSLISGFWGLLIPGAEWFMHWYKNRKVYKENRNARIDRHIRFQRKRVLLRLFVLSISHRWAAQLRNALST